MSDVTTSSLSTDIVAELHPTNGCQPYMLSPASLVATVEVAGTLAQLRKHAKQQHTNTCV
jgi:hypothetical protein